jgi:hypothetical protein
LSSAIVTPKLEVVNYCQSRAKLSSLDLVGNVDRPVSDTIKYVVSMVKEELLLFVNFQKPVHVRSIRMKSVRDLTDDGRRVYIPGVQQSRD